MYPVIVRTADPMGVAHLQEAAALFGQVLIVEPPRSPICHASPVAIITNLDDTFPDPIDRAEAIRLLAIARPGGSFAVYSRLITKQQLEDLSAAGVIAAEVLDSRLLARLTVPIRNIGVVRSREGIPEPELPKA